MVNKLQQLQVLTGMKTFYHIKMAEGVPAVADLSAVSGEHKTYEIHRINVPAAFRGLGFGSMLLNAICKDADRSHVKLVLGVLASGGLTQVQLFAWYKRHGFVQIGSGYMKRLPQTLAVSKRGG